MVEHATENRGVDSSILSPSTFLAWMPASAGVAFHPSTPLEGFVNAISSGSIEAVRFNSLVTIVRGDESIALELSELADLFNVVQKLAAGAARGPNLSALERALASGALDDLDGLDEPKAPTRVVPFRRDAVVDEPIADEGDDDVPALAVAAPVAKRAKRVAAAPVVAAPVVAAPVVAAPVIAAPVVAPPVVAAPVVVPVRVVEPPRVVAVPTIPSAAMLASKKTASEAITQAVVSYLDKRVRPQSFERILRAIRKEEGVPDDVAKNLMEILKRLVKKGELFRSPTGGFSVEAV